MKSRRHNYRGKRRYRVRRDVLNFSICQFIIDQEPSETQPNFSCRDPLVGGVPLIVGGQADVTTVGNTTLGLLASDKAERGVTMGPFRFKYFYNQSPWVNTGNGALAEEQVKVITYSAICKQEYDRDQYIRTGTLVTTEIPNIIHEGIVISGGATDVLEAKLTDPNADIMWRDVTTAVSPGFSTAGTWSQWTTGGGHPPAGYAQNPTDLQVCTESREHPWNVVRVKRRLAEDECLMWIWNIVAGFPSWAGPAMEPLSSDTLTVYGIVAAKLR